MNTRPDLDARGLVKYFGATLAVAGVDVAQVEDELASRASR